MWGCKRNQFSKVFVKYYELFDSVVGRACKCGRMFDYRLWAVHGWRRSKLCSCSEQAFSQTVNNHHGSPHSRYSLYFQTQSQQHKLCSYEFLWIRRRNHLICNYPWKTCLSLRSSFPDHWLLNWCFLQLHSDRGKCHSVISFVIWKRTFRRILWSYITRCH